MANSLKFGNGKWATNTNTVLAYNDENENFKPLPFTFSRASSATVVNQNGLIETVGSGEPRIDFQGNTKGSLLLEPSRTNYFTYSETFSNAYWGLSRIITPILSPVIDVSGGTNAYEIQIASGETVTGGVFKNIADYSNNSMSIFAKKKTADYLILSDSSLVTTAAWFNLSTGVVGTTIGVAAEMQDFGNGWYRCTIKWTKTPTTANKFIYIGRTNGSTAVLGGDSIYIYGAQLEQGSYATSLINTSGSAVTRVADVCNNGGNAQVINSTEGVLYAELELLQDTPNTNMYFGISSGALANSIFFRFNTAGDIVAYNAGLGSSNIIALKSASEIDLTSTFKLAVKYGVTNPSFSFYVNGSKISQYGSFSATAVSGLNQYDFALYDGTSSPVYGKIKDTRVYNTALTDQQLIALTTL